MVDQQYVRGAITGIMSGIIANIFNFALIGMFNVSPALSGFISIVVLGNFLAFTFDIIGAKKFFNGELVSYLDFGTRIKWLGNALVSFNFIKFLITLIIDGTVFNTLYRMARNKLDQVEISFPLRDPIVGLLLSAITYTTYLAPLRFYWAYEDTTSRELDMIIIAWASISLLLYSIMEQRNSFNREIEVPDWVKRRLPSSPYVVR